MLAARRPLDAILADPATPDALREQLGLVGDVRRFGADLGLAVEERYTSYVAWPGDRIVTTVVATRPGEIDPVEFWFPVVGRAPYKGFFDPGRADAEADRLRDEGLDVCLLAVPAYSSLGWFEDPVTGPMLRAGGERLVETLLHELVHATVFVPSRPDWNEGLATFFGQEAAVEFAACQGEPAAQAARRRVTEDRWVAARLLDFRSRVGALYRAAPAGPERDAARARFEATLRDELAALPLMHADSRALASEIRANDACLALRGTYDADLPRYEVRLRALGGDLRRFLAEARSAGDAPDPAGAFFGR